MKRTDREDARARTSMRPIRAGAQATHDAFLATARHLLAEKDFDALSIAEIAAANDLSVGAFYGRFRDKETFFAVLQEQVTAEWMAVAALDLSPPGLGLMDGPQTVAKICTTVVRLIRVDAGFLRAALKHATTQPAAWTPIKRTGHAIVDMAVQVLKPLLVDMPARQRAAKIRFAMQMVYGTCLNAVLHDPGPLLLSGRQLERELARTVCLYLGLATTHDDR